MTEQQYRVVADRDKGDDPQWYDITRGDRYTGICAPMGEEDPVIRIERPVPTTDEPRATGGVLVQELDAWAERLGDTRADKELRSLLNRAGDHIEFIETEAWVTDHPSVPTREQIAEVLSTVIYDRGNRVPDWPADEAATYREWRDDHSIAEAVRQVNALIIRKAADAVLALIQKGTDR